MNLELILWALAFIVVWEVVYILILKYAEDASDFTWFGLKIGSFFGAIIFFVIQIIVLGNWPFQYHRLIYEVVIIGVLALFFWGNKCLYDKIVEEKK